MSTQCQDDDKSKDQWIQDRYLRSLGHVGSLHVISGSTGPVLLVFDLDGFEDVHQSPLRTPRANSKWSWVMHPVHGLVKVDYSSCVCERF